MRVLIILSVLFFSTFLFSQTNCLPGIDGIPVTDEFPGCLLCLNVLQGSNEGYTPDATAYDACGTIENSAWFSFYADETGSMTATFIASNCTSNSGLELSLFDKDLNNLACFTNPSPQIITANNLIPGELHHMMIDGRNGDVCDYTLILSTGVDKLDRPAVAQPIAAEPDQDLCIGEEACFRIEPVRNATEYIWEVPNFTDIVDGGGPDDTFVCVKATTNGGGAISVTPNNTCFTGVSVIKTIATSSIFPGPTISCAVTSNGIDFAWNELGGADSYEVYINGTLTTTTSDTQYSVNNLSSGAVVIIRVQPIGTCSFLSEQLSCTWTLSSVDQNLVSNQLKIVPNPTVGNINIETDLRIEEVEIYDTTGRFLQKEKSASFNLQNQGTGIYFLKIKTSEGVGLKRVLVN